MNSGLLPEPRTEDLDQFRATQRGRMLEYVVLAMSISIMLYLIVLLTQSPPTVGMPFTNVARYLGVTLTLAGGAIAIWLGRHVSSDLAAVLYLLLLWLVLLFSVSPVGFIQRGQVIWFAVIVVASGLLLRPWATIVFAALSASAMVLLAWAEGIPLLEVVEPSILLVALALLAWIYASNIERGNTQLQDALVQVRQREQYNRQLFASNPLPMGLLDIQTQRVLDVNEAALRVYGYKRDELPAVMLQDIWVVPAGEPVTMDLLVENSQLSREQRHRTKDGRLLDVIVSSEPVELPGGTALLVTVQDISERKRAEDQLRLMSRVVEESPVSIVIVNQDGAIEFVNRRFEERMGRSKEEMRGLSWEVLIPSIAEMGTNPGDVIDSLMTGRIWQGEAPAPDASGSLRWYSLIVSPLGATESSLPYVLAIAEDITERHNAEEALRALNNELEERVAVRTAELQRANLDLERSNRLKDGFLAMMSHELRTPLTGILGGSDALTIGIYGSLNPKQENLVALIRDNGSHLLEIVNTLIELSRIGSGDVALQLQPTVIAEICSASVRMVQEQADRKKISITFNCHPYDLELELDQKRMRQIFQHLLSNAIKFTPERGEVGVDVKSDNETQTVHITVWDTGIGIHPDILPLLFKPFSQADSRLNRSYEGTGLGLALVNRLVEMHGGSIGVTSEPGKGSSFTIVLPLVHPMAQQKQESSSGTSLWFGYSFDRLLARRPVILLAEDSPTSVEIVLACLQPAGCDVHVVHNGEQAVSAAVEHHPDLILMDIQMPQMDGIEAARRIRAFPDPAIAKIPIVALTALAMYGDRERCLEAGMDDYISKPFKLDTLIDTLQKFLIHNGRPHPANEGNDQ